MKHRLNLYFLAVVLFGSVSVPATAQKYSKGLVDKTIALIGNDMIQLSTLEAEVQMMLFRGVTSDKNLRCEVLENLLVQKLFLTQARLDSLTVSQDMVQTNLNQRVQEVMTQLGGEKATEEYFKKPMYKIRQEWSETLSEQSLVQNMQSNIAQKAPALTPSDVERYYKNTPKDSLPIISTQYQYSHILIYPNKEDAVMAVKEKLLSFRDRVMKGEKFSTLATIYSEDPNSAAKGGALGMAAKQFYVPAFSDAAMSLKVGQVSQIVETPYGFHIIQLIAKEGDMFNARHILLKPQYTSIDRTKAFSKLDSLKKLILADSIKFEMAARRFSQDLKTFVNGGLVADENSGSTYFDKDQLNPADYKIIENIKVGEISEPFESVENAEKSGNTVYKIIRLDKIIPSHIASFKEDFSVLQDEFKNQAALKAIDEFVTKKQKSTFIIIDPLFANCPFKREGWIK
ncbi:MAG: peptidylprolyl isomerase [Bacteroidales bacterium]|jgi:peptidyl-prolyl cis-trans isomerase SurA